MSRKNIETFGMGVRDLRRKKNIKAAHELEREREKLLGSRHSSHIWKLKMVQFNHSFTQPWHFVLILQTKARHGRRFLIKFFKYHEMWILVRKHELIIFFIVLIHNICQSAEQFYSNVSYSFDKSTNQSKKRYKRAAWWWCVKICVWLRNKNKLLKRNRNKARKEGK